MMSHITHMTHMSHGTDWPVRKYSYTHAACRASVPGQYSSNALVTDITCVCVCVFVCVCVCVCVPQYRVAVPRRMTHVSLTTPSPSCVC